MKEFKANQGKDLVKKIDGVDYMRIPIKTDIIMPDDKLEEVLDQYVKDHVESGDVVFIAESVIACMQQRLVKTSDVKPRKLALLLSKLVYKNPADLDDPGLAVPETMEMVMREVGTFRILLATAGSAVGKLFGKRGIFYKIAGPLARDVDGPTPYAIPPYNEYIVLGPEKPQEAAEKAKSHIKSDVAIVDVNDLGGNVLGNSSKTFSDELILKILKDNPLGQGKEQTPIGIIRKA